MEIVTAVSQSAGVVFFVFHDGELAQIAQGQTLPYNRKTCSVLGKFNPEGVALATGAGFLAIRENGEIENGLTEAFAMAAAGHLRSSSMWTLTIPEKPVLPRASSKPQRAGCPWATKSALGNGLFSDGWDGKNRGRISGIRLTRNSPGFMSNPEPGPTNQKPETRNHEPRTTNMESTVKKITDLDKLFHPESIAHVGVSSRPVAGRFNFTQFLIHMKYEGRIYPVNPKYDTLFDMPCYPTLADVPRNRGPRHHGRARGAVVEILEGTPKGKVWLFVIHTSGFGEINKGHLEQRVRELAADRGFRVIGPNCMGIYSQAARVGFWKDHWEIVDRPGAVGFLSQSGGHAVNAVLNGINSGLNFNKVISLGNQLDVSIAEVIATWGMTTPSASSASTSRM